MAEILCGCGPQTTETNCSVRCLSCCQVATSTHNRLEKEFQVGDASIVFLFFFIFRCTSGVAHLEATRPCSPESSARMPRQPGSIRSRPPPEQHFHSIKVYDDDDDVSIKSARPKEKVGGCRDGISRFRRLMSPEMPPLNLT